MAGHPCRLHSVLHPSDDAFYAVRAVLGHQQQKFIAAIADQDISLTQTALHGCGHGLQCFVSHQMSKAVVDRLELVHIDHRHTAVHLAPGKELIKIAAGVGPGQGVYEGAALHAVAAVQQQPVARDLRQISAALKMITDMERIGDQAEDIAEIVTFLRGRTAEHDDMLCQMARATISMVTESVDAYIKHDTIKAEAVLAADDTVDAYFEQVKHALIGRIAADPADGEYALDLLMIAKYFERIGDHATNIAEWVIFSITGRHKEG